MHRAIHFGLSILRLAAWATCIGCASTSHVPHHTLSKQQLAAVNQLSHDINLLYGFRDGVPRVNLGPCGRFAKAFREEWNARSREKINIVFVMSSDRKHCHHVLVRLPNGDYYDGGNGVISTSALLQQYAPGTRLDEMIQFDITRLDKWSYGLTRDYPVCPNYSDEATLRLIKRHLDSF